MTRFEKLADRITYPGYKFAVLIENGREFLRVACEEGYCNTTKEAFAWFGRKWRLSPHMTDMEFVNTAFLAIVTAQEHESRELFKVDNIPVMDSHRDLDQVLDFMKTGSGHYRAVSR